MIADTLTHRALRLLEFFGPLTAHQIGAVLDRDAKFMASLLGNLIGLKAGAAVARAGKSTRRCARGYRSMTLWAITDAGRAVLALGCYPIQAGGMAHLTLSRASAAPLSAAELHASVCRRYDLDILLSRVGVAVGYLQSRGLLARETRARLLEPGQEGVPGTVYTYTLTREGEDMLTRLPRPA